MGGGEEAGFDGVGGEFAELVLGEAVAGVREDVFGEEVGVAYLPGVSFPPVSTSTAPTKL